MYSYVESRVESRADPVVPVLSTITLINGDVVCPLSVSVAILLCSSYSYYNKKQFHLSAVTQYISEQLRFHLYH